MADHKVISWEFHTPTSIQEDKKIEHTINEHAKEGYKILSHQIASPTEDRIYIQIIFVKEEEKLPDYF